MIRMLPNFSHFDLECNRICKPPKIYRPICGSDGTTYDNKCHMKVAACESDSNITIKHPGKCRDYEADCGSMSFLLYILVDCFLALNLFEYFNELIF